MPLAEKAGGGHATRPPRTNAYSGHYPLARFLFVYVNKAPGKTLDPVDPRVRQARAVARKGQEVVVKDGYFPIPAQIAKEELGKIQ